MTATPRIACLFVPDFRLQVHLRVLGGDPQGGLALVDPEDGRRLIVAASPNARLDGVRRGLTAVTAVALAPEVMIREVEPASLARAQAALEEAVRSCAPVFESTGMGVIYATFAGLDRRYEEDGEGGLLDDLRDAALREGLPARTGMAGTRFAARAAAIMEGRLPSWGRRSIQVPPGQERAFLAPLPLEVLPDASELLESLGQLGLHTLGDLAALPGEGVARRFGPRGVQLQRLARGEDRAVLIPTPERQRFRQIGHADAPIVTTDALGAFVRPLIDALCLELDEASLAARSVRWSWTLEGGARTAGRTVSASPSAVARLWDELLTLSWAQQSLLAPITGVEIEGEDLGLRPTKQENLVGARTGPPGALNLSLAHLHAEVGAESLGSLRIREGLAPEARQDLRPFSVMESGRSREELWVADRRAHGALTPAWRRFDPPEPLEVDLRDNRPVGLRTRLGRVGVLRTLGPWETSSGWWQEGKGRRRRHFQVEVEGGTAWIVLDPAGGTWSLDGWMD